MSTGQSSDHKPNDFESRLTAIQRRLTWLVVMGIVQSVVLSLVLLNQFIPKWSTLLLMLIVLGLMAYIFRNQLPSFLGRVFRTVFDRLSGAEKTGSRKDIH